MNSGIKLIIKKDFMSLRRSQFSDLLFMIFISMVIGITVGIIYSSYVDFPLFIEGLISGHSIKLFLVVQFVSFLVLLSTQLWFLYLLRPSTWFSSERSNFILFSKLKINYYQVYRGKYLLNKLITSWILIIYIFVIFISIVSINKTEIPENIFQIRVKILSIVYLNFLWDSVLRSILYIDTIMHNALNNRRYWIGYKEGVLVILSIILFILFVTSVVLWKTSTNHYILSFFLIISTIVSVNLLLRFFFSQKLKSIDKMTYQGVIYASY